MNKEAGLFLAAFVLVLGFAALIMAVDSRIKPLHPLTWRKLLAGSALSALLNLPYLLVAASTLVITDSEEEKDPAVWAFTAWMVTASLATFYLVTICLARCMTG